MTQSPNNFPARGTNRWRAIVVAFTAVIAFTAASLVPLTAHAATYVLRPNNTTSLQSGWTVTPGTSTADAVLNKPVVAPASPSTSSYLTAGPGSTGNYAGVSVSDAPAFQTGETLKNTTAWAYVSTTSFQSMTLTLWRWVWFFGYQQIASTTIPAGSPAGWYSASTQANLDSFELHNLSIGLQPSGTGNGSRAYAAHVGVETNDPPQTPSVPSTPTPTPTPTVPPPPSPPTPRSAPLSPISLAAPIVKLAPRDKDVPVVLSCAAGTLHGCSGQLVLSLLAPSTNGKNGSGGKTRAVAARCARGCRVLGRSNFQIAAGGHKRVKVHLAHSASRLFHGRHSMNVKATTITRDSAGHTQTTDATLTLTQAAPAPKPHA
jgi:hypothetical protein